LRQQAPSPIDVAVALAGPPKPSSWRLLEKCAVGRARNLDTSADPNRIGNARCVV
jgi:hypothetical protein